MSNTYPFEIIRASRRSISIQISPSKGLVVRAPFSVPEDIIHAFVDKKADWIKKHMGQHQAEKENRSASLYYLGQSQAFEYHPLQKVPVSYSDGVFTFSQKIQTTNGEQAALA